MVHTVVKFPIVRQEIESNGKLHAMFLVPFQGYLQGWGYVESDVMCILVSLCVLQKKLYL